MLKSRDIRGLAFLLPLLAVLLLIVLLARRQEPRADEEPQPQSLPTAETELFEFDPNTAEYEELLALGFSKYAANALLHWRIGGKVFSIKEDVHLVRGVSDSLYNLLKPYIVIDSRFAQRSQRREPFRRDERPKPRYRPFRIDTVTVSFLSTVGFSERQAEVVIAYRDSRGGFYNMEEFASCYVVDSAMCSALSGYIIFPPREERASARRVLIEINSADSSMLRSIVGIGPRSVTEILDYRRRLGGFYDLKQLSEIPSVSESNFEKILAQIYCDTCNISKIDINFAPPAQIYEHPYIGRRHLRRLIHKRELKGGWSKIGEMVDDEIFTAEEAAKLHPYLRFTKRD